MRLALSLPMLALAAGSAQAQQAERFTLDGGDVAIYNLAGAVAVEPGSGSTVVQVTRGGAGAGKLTVEQGEIDDRQTLRVRYPSDDIVYAGLEGGSSTTLRVRQDGTFGDGDYGHGDDRDHGRRHREEGHRVRISGSGGGLAAHADLRVTIPSGVEAAIYLAVGKVSVANVNGQLRVDAHSAPVTATGVKGELTIDVGSGSVNVTRGQGALLVDTGSGDVQVSGFRGTELTVDTGSGEVTVSEVETGELRIETGSGDIRIGGATAPALALETGSGSVTAELLADFRDLSVETGSGNISVTAPGTIGAEVEIETASGDIETDFPLQVTRHARDHLVGRIGNGGGRIAMETGSGDIRLLKRSS